MLATKDSGGKSSWKDGNGILLDSHCKQLRRYASLCLIRVSSVVREGNGPSRDDQAQSCNQGKHIILLLIIFPLIQVVLSSQSR